MPAIPPDDVLCLQCFEFYPALHFEKPVQTTRAGVTRIWERYLNVWPFSEDEKSLYKQHIWRAPDDKFRRGNLAIGQACARCRDEKVFVNRVHATEDDYEMFKQFEALRKAHKAGKTEELETLMQCFDKDMTLKEAEDFLANKDKPTQPTLPPPVENTNAKVEMPRVSDPSSK